jgi:tripartite-type tricarboxylate transporter receptor subunit TctC
MSAQHFTRVLCAAALLVVQAVAAQDYPSKPIHLIVPYPAGGAVDIIGRTVGQALAERLKQPVIVDNRPGASANIGMEAVAKAAPDGYTLLVASNGIATNMALFPTLSFDGRKSFAPIGRVGYAPLVIVVPAASTTQTLSALISEAKASPGKLTYASAGNGSSGHLAGELLKSSAGIDVLHVPYKGGAPAISDLLGERISFMPINPLEVIAHIRAQKLKALAVASDKRLTLLPDVPTASEAGLKGFEATVWWGLAAPAGTPRAIVTRLNDEMNNALGDPAFAKKLEELGVVVTPGTPEQFAQFIGAQTELWTRVIKNGDIRPD